MDILKELKAKFAKGDTSAAIALALYEVAESLSSVAYQLKSLGNADAATEMGAIEALSIHIKDGLDHIANVIEEKQE